jgi:hypothetical protein
LIIAFKDLEKSSNKIIKQQQEATQLFSNSGIRLLIQILLLSQKNSDKKLKCKVPG